MDENYLFLVLIQLLVIQMSLQLGANEFSLNERNGSDLPTDRMCTAADPIFQRVISEDQVQNVMMRGREVRKDQCYGPAMDIRLFVLQQILWPND